MAALPAVAAGWQLCWNCDWSRRPLHFGGLVAGWKVDLSHVGCRQRRLPHLASAIPQRDCSAYYFRMWKPTRSEEHTSELQSRLHLVCRLLLEKKKKDSSAE